MHKGDLKKGGRKYVALLVGYEVDFLEATLNGVQGDEGSNPFAPTKRGNDYGGLSIVISRHFCCARSARTLSVHFHTLRLAEFHQNTS